MATFAGFESIAIEKNARIDCFMRPSGLSISKYALSVEVFLSSDDANFTSLPTYVFSGYASNFMRAVCPIFNFDTALSQTFATA